VKKDTHHEMQTRMSLAKHLVFIQRLSFNNLALNHRFTGTAQNRL